MRGRSTTGKRRGSATARGFTLIEVLVALVIVALGMSALLETLSASANNISALRDKTVAEWIAMNQIANARLALTAPSIGITDGDVRNCADGNWHWQQQVAAVDAVPGLMSITVSVQRTGAAAQGSDAGNSGSSGSSTGSGAAGATAGGLGAGSSGAIGGLGSSSLIVGCTTTSGPGSSLGSTGTLGAGGSIGAGSSIGATASIGPSGGIGPGAAAGVASGSSANPAAAGSAGAAGASTTGSITALFGANAAGGGKGQNWLITLTGFRGNSLGAATGESPDWTGSTFAGQGGANGIPNGAPGGGVIQNSPSQTATP